MADVKWIKLTTDMFDNRKIKHLRRLPEGNNIVLIWVMLLTMAGRCNASGMIFLTENIPYTTKMLADELDFEENTVKLALNSLEQLNMIVANNGFFAIAGWNEYQNIDGMEKIRESKRLAQARWRAKQKALPESNVDSTVESTRYLVDHAEEDIDKEIERDIEEVISDSKESVQVDKTKTKSEKIKHGEFKNVKLTEAEYHKLCDDYGFEMTAKAVDFLDAYIEEKGYKSKSHNLAIRRWVVDAVKENESKTRYGRSDRKQNVMQPSLQMGDEEMEAIRRMMGM